MKLTWDDHNMLKAFHAAKRSPDPTTKHGAVIVDRYNRPISDGYNGYARHSKDDMMPKNRPDKYLVTLHAEENAILNATRGLRKATLYVTGFPCSLCWSRIIQKDIRRVVYGPNPSVMLDQANQRATELILQDRSIEIVSWVWKLSVLLDYLKELGDDLRAVCVDA